MSIANSVNGFLDLPLRPAKPREVGVTHVMDKGLSLSQIEGLMATGGEYVDIVKLGWGTSYVTQNLREKLALYRSLGIPVICGGTLLEIAEARGKLDGYRSWLSENGFESVEVSDGTIDLPRERKLEIIETLAKDFRVLSEVGSKDSEAIFAPYQWVGWIREEIAAGAWKGITEAREAGTARAGSTRSCTSCRSTACSSRRRRRDSRPGSSASSAPTSTSGTSRRMRSF